MTPAQLESACLELFGESWKGSMADALGIDGSTRWRYLRREVLPGPVTTAVSAWLLLNRSMRIRPPETPQGPFLAPFGDGFADMGADELQNVEAEAEKLFGKKWKNQLRKALGIDGSTLWRYLSGDEIPGPIVATIRAWVLIKRLTGLSPPFIIDDFKPERIPLPEDAYRRKPDGSKPRKSAKYARLITAPEEQDD